MENEDLLNKIKLKINLIELEMLMKTDVAVIAKDMIEILALYEMWKNRKEKGEDE